jgi:electron transport complex, RnfABCDGE type, G subunit
MAKLASSLKNMVLSLGSICIISATLLAFANEETKNTIAESQRKKLENAIREVVPEFDNSPLGEMSEIAFSEKDIALIYPAKKGDELVGMAVETSSFNGFSGQIRILTGLSPDGTVLNYSVLQHSETPGLGDKMGLWFKTDKNNQSILGKNLSRQTLKLKKDGGEVDGITASTITSRAFLEAVNKAYSAYSGDSDAQSAATPNADGDSGATEHTGTENVN